MKILLDECIPRKFKFELAPYGYTCMTVPEAGFAGKRNGALLTLAEGSFDAFVTVDKNVQYQQNLAKRKISIVIIRAKSNRLADIRPHTAACHAALQSITPGDLIVIDAVI